MHIGQLSRLTSVTVDAIRFYERHALLPRAPRTQGRFRIYCSRDVSRLEFIREMQGLGFSLREVKQLLDLREYDQTACPEVRDLLEAKLASVRSKIRELEQLQQQLMLDLRKCDRELKARKKQGAKTCPILASCGGIHQGLLC